MGEQEVKDARDGDRRRDFVRALLSDLAALERMIEEGRIESGVRRIGAEQELCLVDEALRPAPVGEQVLARLSEGPFTTELGRHNLEINLDPRELSSTCLGDLERELTTRLDEVREAAGACGATPVLAGILPTLEAKHLDLSWMTPLPRYRELNRVMSELRGAKFETHLKGLEELHLTHDNVMLEACNTSFQVHFQVGPEEFPRLYNLAQAVTAPVLAASVNSPLLLGRRLWSETRVALFQQSLDTRSATHTARGQRQRVRFGDRWVASSVLELFREDVARFRVLLAGPREEGPLELLDRGETPRLLALCLHNGTVYRWNRPCYGVKDGRAHLRIEHRVLPAGPSVRDEVASAAFFFGLLSGLGGEYGDITRAMAFEDAKANFTAAARYGLEASLQWIGGQRWSASELVLKHLLPLAREGLLHRGIEPADVDLYLGVVEERVRSGRTGARWLLDSLGAMGARGNADARARALVRAMVREQERGRPVHAWPLANLEPKTESWWDAHRYVRQVMVTDLFTVGPEDLVDLAANVMDWEHLRHVPVEDHQGRLLGLVSHRRLLRLLARPGGEDGRPRAVRDVMRTDVRTVSPDTSTLEAIRLMREHSVGCLPVVEKGRLVGLLTERDLIDIAAHLLEDRLREEGR